MNSAHAGGLTLSADHDERNLSDGPVGRQLVVVPVNVLEAGLILQTEDQDDGIHPTGKLERRQEEWRGEEGRSPQNTRGAGG